MTTNEEIINREVIFDEDNPDSAVVTRLFLVDLLTSAREDEREKLKNEALDQYAIGQREGEEYGRADERRKIRDQISKMKLENGSRFAPDRVAGKEAYNQALSDLLATLQD